ncbi:MAG: polysaccharide deacetylase family protein [Pseudomonadota bacterium]
MASGLSILMYHQVGEFAPMRAHRPNYCDHRRFAAQMALLSRLRCRVLSLDEALAGLRGEKTLPLRAVVLTFDDGYRNFLEYAHPVLERHGFPALVYVIPGLLGKRAEWFTKDPGRIIPELLSATDIKALRRAGVFIGSHTLSHPKLAECPMDHQRQELRDSRRALEDLLGEPVPHLCYPYGSFDPQTLRLAREAGYQSATTCLRGLALPSDDPMALPRKGISFGDDLLGFAWKVAIKHKPSQALRAWRTSWPSRLF